MDNCIFCKIIGGEIPSATIYEDDKFKVVLDRFPGNIGHVLILPKTHYADIFEIDEDTASELFRLVVKVAKNMKAVLGFEAMNVVQNNGSLAGQTIHHFHLHLSPRDPDDEGKIRWEQLDLTDEQIEDVRAKLEMK